MEFQLSQSRIKELVCWLLDKINKDEFTILNNREKNKIFLRKYNLSRSDIKNKILSKISSSNFIGEETDIDSLKYGPEPLAIFHIGCELIDIFGNSNKIKVYVKIKEKEVKLLTMSVHECEK